MTPRLSRLSLVLLCLGVISAVGAATASAGPLLGRWEGHSASGVTVAFLLGEYRGEVLLADAGELCPPGADVSEGGDATGRPGQIDSYYRGKGDTSWRTVQRVEEGVIDTRGEADWYSDKLGLSGVLGDPAPSLEKGALGHSSGVITKIDHADLPCKVGRVKVHHVGAAPRPDGSYPLAAVPAGKGHVSVSAGGAFVSVEASLSVPSIDPEDPAPCLPFYSTEALETHGGADAFGITLDEATVVSPIDAVGISGAFTGKGTITGAFAVDTSEIGGPDECVFADPFIAKAPKKPVRPPLVLRGSASGGEVG